MLLTFLLTRSQLVRHFSASSESNLYLFVTNQFRFIDPNYFLSLSQLLKSNNVNATYYTVCISVTAGNLTFKTLLNRLFYQVIFIHWIKLNWIEVVNLKLKQWTYVELPIWSSMGHFGQVCTQVGSDFNMRFIGCSIKHHLQTLSYWLHHTSQSSVRESTHNDSDCADVMTSLPTWNHTDCSLPCAV